MHEKVRKLSKEPDIRIQGDSVSHTKCHCFRPFLGDRKQTGCQQPRSKSAVKGHGFEEASGGVCKARQAGRGRSCKHRTLDTRGSHAGVDIDETREGSSV